MLATAISIIILGGWYMIYISASAYLSHIIVKFDVMKVLFNISATDKFNERQYALVVTLMLCWFVIGFVIVPFLLGNWMIGYL